METLRRGLLSPMKMVSRLMVLFLTYCINPYPYLRLRVRGIHRRNAV